MLLKRLLPLFAAAGAISMADDVEYQKPSKEVLDVLHAPATPAIDINPSKTHAVLVRLENIFEGRAPEQRSQAWMERQTGKVWAGLEYMSNGLGKKTYCVGNGIHISLADLAVGCTLAWLDFRCPELDWRSPYPNLEQLLHRLEERPSFASTRPD